MEEVFTDELGNVVTVKYDSNEDLVTVNNNGIDSSFHEVYKCNESEPLVICIEGVEIWADWSDVVTRLKVGEFYWNNKVDKTNK